MPHSDSSPEYWFELASDDEESARILVRESAPPDIAAYHFTDRVALIQSFYSDFRYPRGERIVSSDLARIVKAFDEAKGMLAGR